jgi:hypothetical protein
MNGRAPESALNLIVSMPPSSTRFASATVLIVPSLLSFAPSAKLVLMNVLTPALFPTRN